MGAAGTPRFFAASKLLPGEIAGSALPGDPLLEYYAYLPRRKARRILVSVHGISESARFHAERFAPLAEEFGVLVVAPHFRRPAWQDYQRLGRSGRGPRADVALERLVAVIGSSTDVPAGRFFLFGYSGGGQFAHRYLMAHPRRVASAVIASPGWYTFPDAGRSYPYGLDTASSREDLSLEPDAFLRVPLLVTVGERDVERDETLRRSPRVDRIQGKTRLERAERFVAAMKRSAERCGIPSPVGLRRLPDVGHSFEESVSIAALDRLVFERFFGAEDPSPPVWD
jgi:pimeloyl-ACP methyl ester carboxylesterase